MPHVAVVGAGPSGVFATAAMLKNHDLNVDVFDRSPTPFGLVRYGVAPDHLKIKSVSRVLEKTLTNNRVTFRGNVHLGDDIRLDELRSRYDAVVLATGAPQPRRLGVPGENLTGHVNAADLVSWYNGHPRITEPLALTARAAAVIGAGNVSLDVARTLMGGAARLNHTDVTDTVLKALGDSAITELHIIARRGIAEARFTPTELLEMEKLPGVSIAVMPAEAALARQEKDDTSLDRDAAQRVEILRRWAQQPGHSDSARRVTFWFHQTPVELVGVDSVEAVTLREGAAAGGSEGTDRVKTTSTLPVELVISSIGYRGEPVAGVPFDHERGLIPNVGGRVEPGVYVTGWIKRGPTGIIGANKACAMETAAAVLEDLAAQNHTGKSGPDMDRLLRERSCSYVSWNGWTQIDAAEIDLGRSKGRARTKIASTAGLVQIATSSAAAPIRPQHLPE